MTATGRESVGPARIVDVAREAGVSPMTVSNVVNDRSGVSEGTRARVLAAIEETGYRPNRAAVQLRTRRSRQLGLHVSRRHLSVGQPFPIVFLGELIDAAERADHQLVVFTHPLGEEGSGAGPATSGMDGFVLFIVDPSDPRPRAIADAGLPFAVFGRTPPSLPQAWVDIDNAAAMADVVDHLLDRGHRRFGYVGYGEPEYWHRDRLRGAQERLAEHGIEIPERWLVRTSLEAARASISLDLLGSDRPDAVICGSDSLAALVLAEARRAGLTPGVDIAITGFDALPLPQAEAPTLTSVAMPLTAAADAVVRLVISQIEGRPAPAQGEFLPTHLRVGDST